MSRIFYRYTETGDFDGFLMEAFSPIKPDDINLIEINSDVHLVGINNTLKLIDTHNIPTVLITLDNMDVYFTKESNEENANILDNNNMLAKQLAVNKIDLMQKKIIINKLITQVAVNKIDIIKIKGGK